MLAAIEHAALKASLAAVAEGEQACAALSSHWELRG
jgi:hypothetical protein